jgi:peptidoglycan/LPS O-acetylase OafA/YrhL
VEAPPVKASPAPRRLPGIEGLRALAAASVLVYHVWRFAAPDGRNADLGWLTPVMPHLWHGVTLFFVLSGFLLYRPAVAAVLAGRPLPSVRRYLRNRALRILPAYWVILLITAFALQSFLVTDPATGARVEGLPPSDLLVVNLLFIQNYAPDTMFTGIGPAWSLSVEVVFYLVLPLMGLLAAWLALRPRRRRRTPRAAVVVPAVVLMALGLSGKLVALHIVDWEFGVARSFWGLAHFFGLGMLVAVLHVAVTERGLSLPRHWRPAAGTLIVAVATMAIVFGTNNLDPRGPGNYAYNLGAGVAATLLLALVVVPRAAAGRGLMLRVLEARTLMLGGLVSYSIFLWHEPLLRFLRVQGVTLEGGAGFVVNVGLVALVTIVLSTLTYRFVERPALRAKTPAPGRRETSARRRMPREQTQVAP